MKVKIVYGSDIRRWHFPSSDRFPTLVNYVIKTFTFPDEGSFYLQFEDDEGDRVTLSSESDFEEALSIAERENRKSLKLFLIRGSIQQAQPIENQSFSSEWDQNMSSSVQSSADQFELVSQSEIKEDDPEIKSVGKVEVEDEGLQEINEEQSWRVLYQDFIANPAINELIPDFVLAIIDILREDPNQPLELVFNTAILQPDFTPIASHDLIIKKVFPNLSCIAGHAQQFIPVLLSFSNDMVSSLIPPLLQTIDQKLSGENNLAFDVTPVFASLFPSWISMMNANAPPQGCQINLSDIFGTNSAEGTAKAMINKEYIHSNVTCDVCEMSPIRGARFKCCVCSNYDMCASCEEKGSHTPSHPLLKISEPCRKFTRGRMHGLHEMFHGFNRRWNHGHGHHGHHGSHGHHGHHGHYNGYGHHDYHEQGYDRHYDHNGYEEHNRWGNQCNPFSNGSFNCKPRKVKLKAEFESDINIPDRSPCPMNSVLEKLWRMRNSGNVEWGNNCVLVFVKGNKSLSMQESFPVPNAQPGEIVQVSAMIKTPNETGRFCTYYRLQRNGTLFGPRVWVDIFVVDENGESKKSSKVKRCCKEEKIQKKANKVIKKLENKRQKLENKLERTNKRLECVKNKVVPNEDNSVRCMCGAQLIKVLSFQVYGGNRVYCDICGKYIKEEVFHCPSGRTNSHPEGYDLCTSCVDLQMRSLRSIPVKEEPVPQPSAPSVPSLPPSAPPSAPSAEIEIPAEIAVPKLEEVVFELVPDEENSNEPNVEPVLPISEQVIEEKPAVEVDNFKFKKQLEDLKMMGFDNVENLRYLLTQYEGNTERVLQHVFDA